MVIHVKRAESPWVDLRCHEYPENGLLAGLGWGFHPKITL